MKSLVMTFSLALCLVMLQLPAAGAQDTATSEPSTAQTETQTSEGATLTDAEGTTSAPEAQPSDEEAAADEDEAVSPLTATLEAFRVEDVTAEDGSITETLVAATTASPGDLLQYRGTYTNLSDTDLVGLIINGPIPTGTTYQAASRTINVEAVFEVQIGDEPWQELPAFKTVVNEKGEQVRVEAGPADYEQIRWRLSVPLPPEKAAVALYRVQVNN